MAGFGTGESREQQAAALAAATAQLPHDALRLAQVAPD